jgi:UDP-glucuronate 4-epimerase
MKILVTGSAGFIGYHVTKKLLERGHQVVGLDNINDYYDVRLKYGRLAETGIIEHDIDYGKLTKSIKYPFYGFIKLNLEDRENIQKLFVEEKFDVVCNLASQAGVRYSIENPYTYIDSNIVGFLNILECCRHNKIKHLIYASSSSVYGLNTKIPFSEDDMVDNPISLYAATKKANELMAHSYSHLFQFPTTGLRFFTVYGPWGRPDMAPMLFAKAISEGEPIQVFNYGDLSRDFTFIDDIVEGVIRIIENNPQDEAKYKIYNIGCSKPIKLLDFIETMEKALDKKAIKIMMPMQQGDVFQTYADSTKLKDEFGYKPKVLLTEGINKFVEWFKSNKNLIV